MNIDFGRFGNISNVGNIAYAAQGTSMNLKSDFIAKYGNYAQNFQYIDALGNQTTKTTYPYIIAFATFVLMIITSYFTKSEEQLTEEEKQNKKKNIIRKIGKILVILFLLTAIGSVGYGAYLYFTVYLVDYGKWFASLPNEAKLSISAINSIDKLINSANSSGRR